MPDIAFDLWTRRRFGRAAGLVLTLPLLAGAASPADAKHHHHKKKKKKKDPQGCLDPADGQCPDLGELCNEFGSPCCDCYECLIKDNEVDQGGFDVYRCG